MNASNRADIVFGKGWIAVLRRWWAAWEIDHLEQRFVLLSALLIAVVGFGLQALLSSTMTRQALSSTATEAALDNWALHAQLLALVQDPSSSQRVAALDAAVKAEGTQRYALIKVWLADGRILYSNHHDLIGQRFDVAADPELQEALAGKSAADLSDLSKEENEVDASVRFKRLLEVYTPLMDASGRIIGAFEVYRNGDPLVAQITRFRHTLALGLGGGLLLLWGGLWGFVRQAGRALRRDHIERTRLEREREATLLGALSALSESVEAKDSYTAGHIERVRAYAVALARAVGQRRGERREIEMAALLHDVGKLAVPDAILGKPGALDPDERKIMEAHSAKGSQILQRVPALNGVAQLVLHHHEKWDGSGYPAGISGEAIPLGARIIALADAYDAMTTDRPYRPARPHAEALAELQRCSGSHFDPRLVSALGKLADEVLDPQRPTGPGSTPRQGLKAGIPQLA